VTYGGEVLRRRRCDGRDDGEEEGKDHVRKEVFCLLPCDCPFLFPFLYPSRRVLDGDQEDEDHKPREQSPSAFQQASDRSPKLS